MQEILEGQKNSRKKAIKNLNEALDTKYAVFLRSPSGQSAKFKYIYDNLHDAIESSKKFAANAVSHGTMDFTYYVVEIKYRVGLENGKIVDQEV